MLGFIIAMIIVGIIAGYLARLLVPGRDPMSFVQTVVLGVVGSFVGGFLGYVLFGNDPGEGGLQASGIIGSVIGAVIALLIYNAATHRGVGRRVCVTPQSSTPSAPVVRHRGTARPGIGHDHGGKPPGPSRRINGDLGW